MGAGAAGAAAGAAAAAAAAEVKRKHEEEEETLTSYGRDDLTEEWEFKILRSTKPTFRDPESFRRILDEEARAGWVLVEKFDNSRVRLKRRAGRSDGGPRAEVDPYRTYVGATPEDEGRQAIWVIVGLFTVIGIIVFIFA
jgi:hypothetical protein